MIVSEVDQVLARANGAYKVLFALLAGAGLRIGEALGLKLDEHLFGDFSTSRIKPFWKRSTQYRTSYLTFSGIQRCREATVSPEAMALIGTKMGPCINPEWLKGDPFDEMPAPLEHHSDGAVSQDAWIRTTKDSFEPFQERDASPSMVSPLHSKLIDGLSRKEEAFDGRRFHCQVSRVMDLKTIVEVAGGLAGLVSTSLEVERRVRDRQLNTRSDRLRARAGELAKFLQVQTDLRQSGIDEPSTQQTISLTKTDLNNVLNELVRIQQGRPAIKVDDLSPIQRWLLLFVPTLRFIWLIQFAFYFVSWITVLMVFEFKAESRVLTGTVVLSNICASAVLAALLRYWALMEMRWSEGFRPSPSPICRRMLWYSPVSRRELIARAGLLFGLFQFVPFFLASWTSLFRQALTFTQLSVTLVAFYAWSIAELSLANSHINLRFPRNLRFLHWPHNQIAWLWMICFYFMTACTVFLVSQLMAASTIPAFFRHGKLLNTATAIGLAIGLPLSYLLPMYALNRILLDQSARKDSGTLRTTAD